MPLISLFTSTFKPLGNSFKDRKPNIPLNDFNYVIIPNNDLVYVIVPNNDFTYTLIPTNDVSYAIIPDGNLEYTLIPNNDINCIILPDNDLDNVIIPDNDIISTLIPNNDVTYTLIPNTDLTYTLIPNNDIEYTVLKPPAVFYGEITLGEDSVEGTCNCPEYECPRFYVTGDGPTFCDSNIFVITGGGTFFSGWGTIVYNGYYKTVNMDGSNVATYRTDCGSCPITPTPTQTPTPTNTPTPSETPTQTPTVTPSETPIQTPTPTPTNTETPTHTPTETPTNTPTPTLTETPTPTPTNTETLTPTPTVTPTETTPSYLNCYTVRQHLYGYTGSANTALFVLDSDYPDVDTIPIGSTATINGTSVRVTNVVLENSGYFLGGTGYRVAFTPSAGTITSGTYVEFCWYSPNAPTPTPSVTTTNTVTPTPSAVVTNNILLENGEYLLQENNSKIIL